MASTTARLTLPMIEPGQAQKELTHNEALVLLDAAVQPAVEAIGIDVPPAAPLAGQAWIAGAAPTGAWAGQPRVLAAWTAGGWRFVAAREGMAVWDIATRTTARYAGDGWRRASTLAAPAGGTVVDVEGRAAIAALTDALRAQGLVVP